MDIAFWLERWRRGQIGFHQHHINPYLGYYYGEKGPPLEKRAELKVFVPLCGKSKDLWWLQQNGYETLGVECSELAVEQFFTEQQLNYSKMNTESHVSYKSDKLEILLGDFFTLQADDIGNITDIFDRGSLIALPKEMRREYVNKVTELQKPGTRTLLITLTYAENEMDGPPFSFSEKEVHELYRDHFKIEKLAAKNILEDEPRFKDKGLTTLMETAYKLTKNT